MIIDKLFLKDVEQTAMLFIKNFLCEKKLTDTWHRNLLPVDGFSKPHIQPSEHGASPHRFQQASWKLHETF